MYIKTTCPVCKSPVCVDLLTRERMLAEGSFPPTETFDIEVMDTCTLQDLARSVISELSGHVKPDGQIYVGRKHAGKRAEVWFLRDNEDEVEE